MLGPAVDTLSLAIVILGALLAGFTTGFAGFGTGLVASGFWFLALPAAIVPPMIVFTAIAAQCISLLTVRKVFDWSRAAPYLIGGVIGVPLGVAALAVVSPFLLRTSIGAFLVGYASYQLFQRRVHLIGTWGGRTADGIVGIVGGFLGGFAGLSGPPPLIWLQLRGGPSEKQRAIYQPFNIVVLALAGFGMSLSGQVTTVVLWIALMCFPATLLGAWVGTRVYVGVSARTFQRVVLCLLLASGCILVGQALVS